MGRTFREKRMAIADAIIEENHWTEEEAHEKLGGPSSDDVVLGEKSLAKLQDFQQFINKRVGRKSVPTEGR